MADPRSPKVRKAYQYRAPGSGSGDRIAVDSEALEAKQFRKGPQRGYPASRLSSPDGMQSFQGGGVPGGGTKRSTRRGTRRSYQEELPGLG